MNQNKVLFGVMISLISFGIQADQTTEAPSSKPPGQTSKTALPTTSASKNSDEKKGVTEMHSLEEFTSVVLSGVGTLHVKQSTEEGLTIEAPVKVLPNISVEVRGGTLYISLNSGNAEVDETQINYYLKIRNLQNVSTLSSASISIEDGLSTETLNLTLNGFGDANINIKARNLIARINGGGKIHAIGGAINQQIIINGAGEFNGTKLIGKAGTIYINGAGDAKTNTSDSLAINITGDGMVGYCGAPQITKRISGKSSINPLEDSDCK